jgi:hypothetical protein
MRITRQGGLITIRDRPGPFWALGLLLLFGGGVALALALGLASNAGEIEPWARVASGLIGLGVGAGAIWWLRRSSATRAELDLTRQRLTLVRLGLAGRLVVQLELSEIGGVEEEQGTDGDGGVIRRGSGQAQGPDTLAFTISPSARITDSEARACRPATDLPQRGSTSRLG